MADLKQSRLEALDRLHRQLTRAAKARHIERPFGTAFLVPAQVHRFDPATGDPVPMTDATMLERLHGSWVGVEMVEDLWPDEPLTNLSLAGGDMVLEYDRREGRLWLATEYWSPRPLKNFELDMLREFTVGEWTHGVGERATFNLPEELGDLAVTFEATGAVGLRRVENKRSGEEDHQRHEAELHARLEELNKAFESSRRRLDSES